MATPAPMPSGGAETSLDLTTEKDRGLARQAMKHWPKRWRGLSDDFKDKCVEQLKKAASEVGRVKDVRDRVAMRLSIAKTAVMMEGQHQKDDHKGADLEQTELLHADRISLGRERLKTDAERPSEGVRIVIVDARTGSERPVGSLREFYDATAIDVATPAALPLPARDAPGSQQKQAGQSGATGRENGLAHR